MKRILVCLLALAVWATAGDQVKEINNGMAPAGKAITYKLTEDLAIGPKDDLDYTIWPGIDTTVDADANGHIYVCDAASGRIVEFDQKGAFVRTIGQKGSGPGEFQALKSFQVLGDNSRVALEQLQVVTNLSFFDSQGKFIEKKSSQDINNIITSAQFSPDGKWAYSICVGVNPAEQNMETRFAILDKDLKFKESVMKFTSPSPDPSQFGKPDYWAKFLSNSFKRTSKGLIGFVAFGEHGEIYTAKASAYQVTRLDSDLKPSFQFGRKYKPLPMTKQEIDAIIDPIYETIMRQLPPQLQTIVTPKVVEKAVELAEFPAVKNPIGGLKTTPDGHVLVIHDPSLLTQRAKVDIFSKDGLFLGSFEHDTFGTLRMIFKNGYAYTIENRDEENTLVRYKVQVTEAGVM